MENEKTFISFKKKGEGYIAFTSLSDFLADNNDLEGLLIQASDIYKESIISMSNMLTTINSLRNTRSLIPARVVWEFGDVIMNLINRLSELNFHIDSVYSHLERDLGAKRKWLEKVVIFRRYISDKQRIPESLNWGKCEKGTRRKAQQIQHGVFIT
jgi:hypothetical protein